MEKFYVVGRMFTQGKEGYFSLRKFNSLKDAMAFRNGKVEQILEKKGYECTWVTNGDMVSCIILRGDDGHICQWNVFSMGEALKAIKALSEVNLDKEVIPWTDMDSEEVEVDMDGNSPQYRPYKVIDGKVHMTMRCGESECDYVSSLDGIGDEVLANIFVHL